MGRPPVAERMGDPKRGPWTPDEDIKLASYIQKHGPGSWRLVPKNAGLQRCGKSCRLRWKNHLCPGIKRGNFTPEEDQIIIRYQALKGNRWAEVAARLARTDNDIKNYWHTYLKKKLGKVNSSGDERAENNEDYEQYGDVAITGGLDYIKAYYDKMYKNAIAGNSITNPQNSQEKERIYMNETAENSITTPPQNQENESFYDDTGIPSMEEIEKLLLEDPTAPVPQVPPPSPQVPPAPAPSTAPEHEVHDDELNMFNPFGDDDLLNMFTPSGDDEISFGPFY